MTQCCVTVTQVSAVTACEVAFLEFAISLSLSRSYHVFVFVFFFLSLDNNAAQVSRC